VEIVLTGTHRTDRTRPIGVRRTAVHAVRGHADSLSVEQGSEFARILDAELAAAAVAFGVPADESPVVDARFDPAIRFAMWGGGIPSILPGLARGPALTAQGYPESPAARVDSGVESAFRARGASAWASAGVHTRPMLDRSDREPFSSRAGRMAQAAGVASDVPPAARAATRAARPAPPTSASNGPSRTATHGQMAVPLADWPPARRVARHLSVTERAALELLKHCGASTLRDDFTDEELKAAYRQLAFRFHPDQHPGASAAERLALGRSFAQVHAAYRSLARR
jgi:hypothetical protein